jgi:hypothetical protein
LTSAYNEAAMCELLPPVFPTENVWFVFVI